jgi:hypothetical protein
MSASLTINGTTFTFPISTTPQLTVLAGEDRELTNSGGINAFLEIAPLLIEPASTFARDAAGRPLVYDLSPSRRIRLTGLVIRHSEFCFVGLPRGRESDGKSPRSKQLECDYPSQQFGTHPKRVR